jgi:hypothetical protein
MQQTENNFTFSSDVAPMFDKTLLGSIQRQVDPEKWDRVGEQYENKKYREAVLGILDYVDSSLAEKTGNKERTLFVIPHGSAIVEIKIDDEGFYVSAPFLTVPSTHNVPLLRQVAQLNLFPLNLSNIALEEDRLIFKYNCPLELCEPYKIYNVLREICAYADAYDDEFITKFNARRVHEPVIKIFPQNYIDLAWNRIRQYIDETTAYVDYFEKKRLLEVCVDIITITLMKIDYYLAPQGVLRTDIEKTVSQLQDQDLPLTDKMRKGMERLNYLKEYDRGEFVKNLYVAEVFIPLKFNFTGEMIDPYFQMFYETAQKEMASREYIGAVMTLQTAFLNLFYHYIFPDDIKETITGAMEKAGHKSWDKASNILWEAMEDVMSGEKPRRKKGFWGTLFGGKTK